MQSYEIRVTPNTSLREVIRAVAKMGNMPEMASLYVARNGYALGSDSYDLGMKELGIRAGDRLQLLVRGAVG